MSTTKEWVPDRQSKKERVEKRGQVGAPLEESDRHTAVGNHRAAGHEAGAIGKQERGSLRDFFRGGHALHRMQSRNELQGGRISFPAGGRDRSTTQSCIGEDIRRRVLPRHLLHKAAQAGLWQRNTAVYGRGGPERGDICVRREIK